MATIGIPTLEWRSGTGPGPGTGINASERKAHASTANRRRAVRNGSQPPRRGIGLPQSAPGAHPAFDALKVAALRTVTTVVEPLRKSELIRRTLRRIAFGKHANYYYGAGKQAAS